MTDYRIRNQNRANITGYKMQNIKQSQHDRLQNVESKTRAYMADYRL